MPKVDPDKNPIRQILEDSQQPVFAESDHEVFQAIASFHDVPYLPTTKKAVWEGRTAAEEEEEEELPLHAQRELHPEQMGGLEDKDEFGLNKTEYPLVYKGLDPETQKPTGVQEPGAGIRSEEFATGGSSPFNYIAINQANANTFNIDFNNGQSSVVTVGEDGNIADVDGVSVAGLETPEEVQQVLSELTPQQLAAIAILTNKIGGKKDPAARVGLGAFEPAVQTAMQDPTFAEQVQTSISKGPTKFKAITEHLDTKLDEETYINKLLQEELQRGSAPANDYNELREKAGRAQAAMQNGEEPSPDDRRALQMLVNYMQMFKGTINKVTAEQGKKDNPSPKAAEEVFKALENEDHEAAHHWMKQTDCPMGCETQNNEGVCRHGYMSAGRTRVVFLDKDIRRANIREADFWGDLGDVAENAGAAMLGPGGTAIEGIGNALGVDHPLGQAVQQGAENLGGLFNAIVGPGNPNPGNAPKPGSPEYNHLMEMQKANTPLTPQQQAEKNQENKQIRQQENQNQQRVQQEQRRMNSPENLFPRDVANQYK